MNKSFPFFEICYCNFYIPKAPICINNYMGIDGRQHLELYGPKESMDALEASRLVLETENEEFAYLGTRFFGKEVSIKRLAFNHIGLSYEFRNEPIYEYLTELLVQHPKCWLKNEYHTEDGDCAIWIARMV